MNFNMFYNTDDECGIFYFVLTCSLYKQGYISSVKQLGKSCFDYNTRKVPWINSPLDPDDAMDIAENKFDWVSENKQLFIDYYSRSARDNDILSRMYDKICRYSQITEYPGGIMYLENDSTKLFSDDVIDGNYLYLHEVFEYFNIPVQV